MFYCNVPESKHNTVTNASQVIDLVLTTSKEYRFMADTACWIAQGATPVAVANTDGSMYVSANEEVIINGGNGAGLAVIRDSADGDCTLTPVTVVR